MDGLLQQLESQVSASNVDDGLKTLQQIKLAMLTSEAHDEATTQKYMSALELGVLLAIAAEDLDAFGRNMQQLQPLYASSTTATSRKNHILGLNLMLLLVENRLSEFHSELELLDSTQQEQDVFLQFPIALERKMMVGIYDEVLQMKVPDPSYQFFMDQLVQTVRDSIADCMEVSYQQLTLKQASELMKFEGADGVKDLSEYITSMRDDWIVDQDKQTITFQPVEQTSAAQDIPSMQWIQQSLAYATEMERIV